MSADPTPPAPMSDEAVARSVAIAARDFCAELCEDSPDVPQPQLKALHEALDIWEGVEPEQGVHDDSSPRSAVLAALGWLANDTQATDKQRQIARQAIAALQSSGVVGELVEALELARSYIVPGRNGSEVRDTIDAALAKACPPTS